MKVVTAFDRPCIVRGLRCYRLHTPVRPAFDRPCIRARTALLSAASGDILSVCSPGLCGLVRRSQYAGRQGPVSVRERQGSPGGRDDFIRRRIWTCTSVGTVEAVPQRHGRVPGPGPLDRTGGPVRGGPLAPGDGGSSGRSCRWLGSTRCGRGGSRRRWARRPRPTRWMPGSAPVAACGRVLAHAAPVISARDGLVKDRTAARNRSHHARHPMVKRHLRQRLAQIERDPGPGRRVPQVAESRSGAGAQSRSADFVPGWVRSRSRACSL